MMNFENLIVWKKSMALVADVYKVCNLIPKEEIYGICQQMKRSAVSVPSNIAEGQQRESDKEFVRFINIAKGSLAELVTQTRICQQTNLLAPKDTSKILAQAYEVSKMLFNLRLSLLSPELGTRDLGHAYNAGE